MNQTHGDSRPHREEVQVMRACPPISALGPDARENVLAEAEMMVAAAGEVIVREGQPGDSFFIVLSGSIQIYREVEGQELSLAELGPGAYFGEQALLSGSLGRRTASVRTRLETRYATISKRAFKQHIESAPENRDAFERDASDHLFNSLRQSLSSYARDVLDESGEGVQRREFKAGETVFEEGAASNSAFLILSGIALVARRVESEYVELARLGSSQIFGELGVLRGEDRSATVRAETDLVVLEIAADVFAKWHHSNKQLGGLVDSLTDVYALAEGRNLTVFRGEVDGMAAVSTMRGTPQDGVVSTRILGSGLVVFTNARLPVEAEDLAEVSYQSENCRRTLRVLVHERRHERITKAEVYGLSAEGIRSDLGTLYQSVAERQVLGARELNRFARSGFVGRARGTNLICPCFGLSHESLSEAVEDVGADFAALRDNYGVGTLCGGCESAVRTFVSELQQSKDSIPLPEVTLADLTESERWLATTLQPWDEDGDGRVTRNDVEVRLRSLGVRDLGAAIDAIFGGTLKADSKISLPRLARGLSRGPIGFNPLEVRSRERDRLVKGVWKVLWVLYRPRFWKQKLAAALVGVVALFMFLGSLLGVPWWATGSLFALVVSVLSTSSNFRFTLNLIMEGPWAPIPHLYREWEHETILAPMKTLWFKLFFLRDERMIDRIYENPDIYSRDLLIEYPPFGANCALGSGTSGYWLGYRALCEEYFLEGYLDDFNVVEDVTRERLSSLPNSEFDLLGEIYRIIVEIRGRMFFQRSYGCFDPSAPRNFAQTVDNLLSVPLWFFGVATEESEPFNHEVMTSVREATGSIGKLLRAALESGSWSEEEVRQNASMYVLAQAPTMGIFWTLAWCARQQRFDWLRREHGGVVKALKETLRLHPPVTTPFKRHVMKDDHNAGHLLRKGSAYYISALYLHTSPALWEDPYEYRPETWTVVRRLPGHSRLPDGSGGSTTTADSTTERATSSTLSPFWKWNPSVSSAVVCVRRNARRPSNDR